MRRPWELVKAQVVTRVTREGKSRHLGNISFKMNSLHPPPMDVQHLFLRGEVPGTHPAMLHPRKVPYPCHRSMMLDEQKKQPHGRL